MAGPYRLCPGRSSAHRAISSRTGVQSITHGSGRRKRPGKIPGLLFQLIWLIVKRELLLLIGLRQPDVDLDGDGGQSRISTHLKA